MNRKQFFVLNTVSISLYSVCSVLLGFEISESSMFATNDSNSYIAVADWIFGGEITGHTAKRPLLFPLMMVLPYKIAGIYGIWFLQFSCWLVGINLCVRAVVRWSKKELIGWIVLGILLSNLSLIAMTFHALSEIPTFFFLSLLLHFIVTKIDRFRSIYFIHGILFFLVLLTLIKGVFYYMVLLCLVMLIVFYGRKYLKTPRSIAWLALILVPLFAQMSIVKKLHGEFVVSTIGGDTFDNYYFAKAMSEIEGSDRGEVIQYIGTLTSQEKKGYILNHKKEFYEQFVGNVKENIEGDPIYLNLGRPKQNLGAFVYMKIINRLIFILHWFGLIVILINLYLAFRFKRFKDLTLILIIAGLMAYYILTTGLSFWQGDRLVLPSIALWSVLYPVMIMMTIHQIKRIRNQKIE